jgi:hypothetical protein
VGKLIWEIFSASFGPEGMTRVFPGEEGRGSPFVTGTLYLPHDNFLSDDLFIIFLFLFLLINSTTRRITKVFLVVAASDLDSIRALFNEKEKELTMAVAKVEELTRQLEEVRRGKAQQAHQPPGQASQELDRLRRELMVNTP